jgi:RHS repeat-associated protein
VRSATDENGTPEGRYEYDAFGKPYKGDLTGGMNLGYTGKPYDTATGLYNYGYRDYQPEAARFTTADPVRDGNNWFAYVNNDPVNWVDPLGLDAFNNTNHVQMVKPENSKVVPIFPHQTHSGRIDGILTQDGQTFKVSDKDNPFFSPINAAINQNGDTGKYSFSMSLGSRIKNALGDIAKFLTGNFDFSGTFENKAEGKDAADWWSGLPDPDTWDSIPQKDDNNVADKGKSS